MPPTGQTVFVPELNITLPVLQQPADGSELPSQITDAQYAILEKRGSSVSKIGAQLMAYHRHMKRVQADRGGGSGGGGGFLDSILGSVGGLIGKKSGGEGGEPAPIGPPPSAGLHPLVILGGIGVVGGLAWWALSKPKPSVPSPAASLVRALNPFAPKRRRKSRRGR